MSAPITSAGFYPDITPAQYFAEPCPEAALTSSGIQMLAPIGAAPAKFAFNHPALNGDYERGKSTAQQYLGNVVHRLALGKGSEYAISPYDEYRSNEAKAWRADQEAAGIVPIKQKAFDEAEQMAAIIRERIAEACQGYEYHTEVVIAWQETVCGVTVWCRAMLDVWCPDLLLALDVKTTADCSDDFITRRLTDGYAVQGAWYSRGLGRILKQEGRVKFGFLFVETEPPFLARNAPLTEGFRFGGAAMCNRALEVFATCMKRGEWPGYQDLKTSPPPWWVGKIDSITMLEEIAA